MKRTMVGSILGITLFGMIGAVAAEPYVPSGPICSVERTYVIKDATGNVMDSTTYTNNWPIDCITRVEIKYANQASQMSRGEATFRNMTGRENP